MATEFHSAPPGRVVQPCPLARQDAPVHWIEIELLGMDDKPIPYEEYAMRLPDGARITGFLDGKGFARIDNIQSAGTCQVGFPRLDRDAWEPIDTRPA